MGKCSKKNLRGNWQEEDLQNAMRVMRTSTLSTNAAANHCKVQSRTLKVYLATYKQSKSRMGRKTVLSPQQDKELSKRNIRLAQTGYPITSQILRRRVCSHTVRKQYSKFICEGTRDGWSCFGIGYFCLIIPSLHCAKHKILILKRPEIELLHC